MLLLNILFLSGSRKLVLEFFKNYKMRENGFWIWKEFLLICTLRKATKCFIDSWTNQPNDRYDDLRSLQFMLVNRWSFWFDSIVKINFIHQFNLFELISSSSISNCSSPWVPHVCQQLDSSWDWVHPCTPKQFLNTTIGSLSLSIIWVLFVPHCTKSWN